VATTEPIRSISVGYAKNRPYMMYSLDAFNYYGSCCDINAILLYQLLA